MPRLPSVNGREMLRILLKAGFYVHHKTGSHARLLNTQKPELRVTVPVHGKDIPQETLRSIQRQAGFTDEEFRKLLLEK